MRRRTVFEKHETYAIVEDAIPELKESTNGYLRGPCPFCALREGVSDKKWSFRFQRYTNGFGCFRCGVGGRLPGEPEDRPPGDNTEHEAGEVDPPENYFPLWADGRNTPRFLRPALEYLESRGVSNVTIRDARIGACFGGQQHGRVVVPIFAADGETWVGWVARTWFHIDKRDPNAPRPYDNCPGRWRKTALFNHRALFVETDEPIFVVEGVFDAFPVYPDVVALLGKPTDEQREAILEARRPVVVSLDGDAWVEGKALAQRLALRGANAVYIHLPPRSDPCNMGSEWLRAEAAKALQNG